MFDYDAHTSYCIYFPHVRWKDKSLYDFLKFQRDAPKKSVYVLECSSGCLYLSHQVNAIDFLDSGLENILFNNDPITHHLDWTSKNLVWIILFSLILQLRMIAQTEIP